MKIFEVKNGAKLSVPPQFRHRVFKVDSDSNKTYYVQWLLNVGVVVTEELSENKPITICSCMAGFNGAMLSVTGVQTACCKHAAEVLQFIAEGKS